MGTKEEGAFSCEMLFALSLVSLVPTHRIASRSCRYLAMPRENGTVIASSFCGNE